MRGVRTTCSSRALLGQGFGPSMSEATRAPAPFRASRGDDMTAEPGGDAWFGGRWRTALEAEVERSTELREAVDDTPCRLDLLPDKRRGPRGARKSGWLFPALPLSWWLLPPRSEVRCTDWGPASERARPLLPWPPTGTALFEFRQVPPDRSFPPTGPGSDGAAGAPLRCLAVAPLL
jgi:hypothetical protein